MLEMVALNSMLVGKPIVARGATKFVFRGNIFTLIFFIKLGGSKIFFNLIF